MPDLRSGRSLDGTDILQPGKESKVDPVIERMLAALHAANLEGGLTFTEFFPAVQVKGPVGGLTPGKTTFWRKLNSLIERKFVEKSAATDKYLLSVSYSQKRANFFSANTEEVPS